MNAELTQWHDMAAEFQSLVFAGIDKWTRAGEIVASALGVDGAPSIEEFANKAGIDVDIVRRFEQIGRQELYPALLAKGGPGAQRLAACSYREQKLYTAERLPVVVDHDGSVDTLNVALGDISASQCKQVFARDHVRGLAEQRAWMESERAKAAEKCAAEAACAEKMPWSINRGRVTFARGCELGRREITQLLLALEG